MKRNMNKYIAILLLVFSGSAIADAYFCTTNKSTGYIFDKSQRSWVESRFYASKYVIREPEDSQQDTIKFEVVRHGDLEILTALCRNNFGEYGFLNCSGGDTVFRFNRKNKRFLHAYYRGYVDVLPGSDHPMYGRNDGDGATPHIDIGVCTKI